MATTVPSISRASSASSRVLNSALQSRVISAEEAANLVAPGARIGMSGFTGSGYPKAFPAALARRIGDLRQRGESFQISLFTGASTGPEVDSVLASVDGISHRMPYQSDPEVRKRINLGQIEYTDFHLSHATQYVKSGVMGKLDLAVIEVTAVLKDGRMIPSTSVGANLAWLQCAERVILEVNSWQSLELEGLHDIYDSNGARPGRQPIPLVETGQRIGSPYFEIPLDKVVGVILTDGADRNSAFKAPDEVSKKIAGNIIEFLDYEVRKGRLPSSLLPLQSGVGNIANAVLFGLEEAPFEGMTSYTEVIQDGMVRLLETGKLKCVSATALSLSPEGLDGFMRNIGMLRSRVVLRPQDVSNHPEVIRRLGVIAMNAMIEGDVYGNVNSTHIMGSRVQNGIGGSGDFARNAYVSIFMAPSSAQKGAISTIVPMVSHVDHTEHDVQVMVTDQGLADLRGLGPRRRAQLVVERCAHPDYRPMLREYLERADQLARGKHTPHLLGESLGWHNRYIASGDMRAKEERAAKDAARSLPFMQPAADDGAARKTASDVVRGFRMPVQLRYHPGHTWALGEARNLVRVGIDDFAAKLLGGISNIELPAPGNRVTQGQKLFSFQRNGVRIEMLSPIDGMVSEVNSAVQASPETVCQDPYGAGWLVLVQSPDSAANLGNLIGGPVSRYWMEAAADRLQRRIGSDASGKPLLQDGGMAKDDLAAGIPADQYETLIREFFLGS